MCTWGDIRITKSEKSQNQTNDVLDASKAVDPRTKIGIGGKIDARKTRSDIRILRKWQLRARAHTRSSKRALSTALSEFDRVCVKLKLPASVRNQSSELFREAWKKGFVRGASVMGMVGAILFASCRIQRIPRKMSSIASAVGIREKKLGQCYRKLIFGMNLSVPLPNPIAVVPRIIKRVNAALEIQAKAIELLEFAKENNLVAGRDPWGLAGAAIYLAALTVGPRINQITLAEASGVTEVTIRNRSQELKELLGDDWFNS